MLAIVDYHLPWRVKTPISILSYSLHHIPRADVTGHGISSSVGVKPTILRVILSLAVAADIPSLDQEQDQCQFSWEKYPIPPKHP